MPGPTAQPEAVARAVLEKAPVVPPVTPTEQRAQQLREKLAEQGPRSTIESFRERRGTPIEQRRIDEIIDKNIGIERRDDGVKERPAGSEVERRFRDAERWAKLSKDFLEKGYDGLDATQQDDARKFVEQAAMAWPEANAFLSSINRWDRQQAIETILRTPEYTPKVRKLFETATDPSRALDERAVLEAKTKFDEAKRKEDEKNGEVTKNTNDKMRVDTELEKFADRTATGGGKGAKLLELETITGELPTLTTDLADKQEELEIANDEVRVLQYRQRTARDEDAATKIGDDIIKRRTDIRRLQREIATLNEKINRKAALENERANFEKRKGELEEEKVRLDTELKTLTDGRIRAQAELASGQLTRASQEQDFVDGLKSVFSEATMEYLEDKIRATEEAEQQILKKERAETPDPAVKGIDDGLLERWDKKKGGKLVGYNKKQIDGDWNLIMTQGDDGLKTITEDMLKKYGMLTGIEAQDKVKDPDFMKNHGVKVLEKLAAQRIRSGGKITEHEARFIMDKWGVELIDRAIKSRSDLRSTFDRLRDEGVLKGGIFEWYKTKSGGSILKLLLLLLGTATILPIAGMKVGDMLKSE